MSCATTSYTTNLCFLFNVHFYLENNKKNWESICVFFIMIFANSSEDIYIYIILICPVSSRVHQDTNTKFIKRHDYFLPQTSLINLASASTPTTMEILFSVPVFGVTKAGNPVINYGPYRYNRASNSKGPKTRWTCVKFPGGCRSTMYTVENVIILHNNKHCHS